MKTIFKILVALAITAAACADINAICNGQLGNHANPDGGSSDYISCVQNNNGEIAAEILTCPNEQQFCTGTGRCSLLSECDIATELNRHSDSDSSSSSSEEDDNCKHARKCPLYGVCKGTSKKPWHCRSFDETCDCCGDGCGFCPPGQVPDKDNPITSCLSYQCHTSSKTSGLFGSSFRGQLRDDTKRACTAGLFPCFSQTECVDPATASAECQREILERCDCVKTVNPADCRSFTATCAGLGNQPLTISCPDDQFFCASAQQCVPYSAITVCKNELPDRCANCQRIALQADCAQYRVVCTGDFVYDAVETCPSPQTFCTNRNEGQGACGFEDDGSNQPCSNGACTVFTTTTTTTPSTTTISAPRGYH